MLRQIGRHSCLIGRELVIGEHPRASSPAISKYLEKLYIEFYYIRLPMAQRRQT
jgi:hypothetical protein